MLDAIAHDGGREFPLSPEFTETGPTVLSVRLARWWLTFPTSCGSLSLDVHNIANSIENARCRSSYFTLTFHQLGKLLFFNSLVKTIFSPHGFSAFFAAVHRPWYSPVS